MNKQRVFITGEHGMIACAAAHHFLVDNETFELVNWAYDGDEQKTFTAAYKDSKLKELDITSKDFVKKVLDTKPDIIVHTAAYVNTDSCESEPKECINSNIYGTWQVIEAANKVGAKVIFIGTTATYDPDVYDGGWIKEDYPQRPKTIYGITKFTSEELILKYCKESPIVLRPCFAFGGILDEPLSDVNQKLYYLRDTSSNITKIIYNSSLSIIENPKFTLSINYLKDYMSVDDVGYAIWHLARYYYKIMYRLKDKKETFNISLMQPSSWKMYLYMIENELKKSEIQICEYTLLEQKDYLKNHLVDSSKLRKTGFIPKYNSISFMIQNVINKIECNEFVFNEKTLETHK